MAAYRNKRRGSGRSTPKTDPLILMAKLQTVMKSFSPMSGEQMPTIDRSVRGVGSDEGGRAAGAASNPPKKLGLKVARCRIVFRGAIVRGRERGRAAVGCGWMRLNRGWIHRVRWSRTRGRCRADHL